jgi:hypothetical protein
MFSIAKRTSLSHGSAKKFIRLGRKHLKGALFKCLQLLLTATVGVEWTAAAAVLLEPRHSV